MTETVRDATWGDVPRLAWTLGCAYGAGPAWVRRLGALVLTPALGVPTVVAGRLRGRVLHLDRRAVVLVEERMTPARRAGSTVLALLAALPGLAVVVAVLSVLTAGLPPLAGVLVVWGALATPLLPLLWTAAARSRPQVLGVGAARRAGRVPAEAALISMLAAWPQGRGHGGRLLDALGAALAGYPRALVAAARTPQLAAWYGASVGLLPIEAGSLVLMRPAPVITAG